MNGLHRRVFKSAFRRDRRLAQLRHQGQFDELDFEAVADAARAARKSSDRLAFVAAARILRDTGHLRPKMAVQLASALMGLGMPEEARHTLRLGGPPPDDEAGWSIRLAEASLATGLTQDAQAALRTALDRTDGEDLTELGGLQRLLRPPVASGATTWAVARAWLEECIDAGQVIQAARGFAEILACMDPDDSRKNLEDICQTAFSILRMGSAGMAPDVLGSMRPLFDAFGEGDRLDLTLALLRGRPSFHTSRRQVRRRASLLLRACLAEGLAAEGLWQCAVDDFAAPGRHSDMLAELQCELARCVGRQVLAEHPLHLAPPRAPRVFDVFPFNGELLMLEVKLAEMAGWVEKFVLVEASETFSGKPKPLYFEQNRHRFAAYRDKIIHVVIDRFPESLHSPWAREFFQRDMALKGLMDRCAVSDIVVISDVDEIIRERAVRGMTRSVVGASLRLFNFFFNCENVREPPALKTVFANAALVASLGLSYLRLGMVRYEARIAVPAAGWHFSSVGSAAELGRKYSSFSHTEFAHLDEETHRRRIDLIRDGDRSEHFAVREVDEMPRFIRDNRERLAHLLL